MGLSCLQIAHFIISHMSQLKSEAVQQVSSVESWRHPSTSTSTEVSGSKVSPWPSASESAPREGFPIHGRGGMGEWRRIWPILHLDRMGPIHPLKPWHPMDSHSWPQQTEGLNCQSGNGMPDSYLHCPSIATRSTPLENEEEQCVQTPETAPNVYTQSFRG